MKLGMVPNTNGEGELMITYNLLSQCIKIEKIVNLRVVIPKFILLAKATHV